jgi:hypothetical protein
MKRALLKLVAVFEIVSGLAGMYAVVAALVRIAPAERAPILWYGILLALSWLAGSLSAEAHQRWATSLLVLEWNSSDV